jgi:hypothetical protein
VVRMVQLQARPEQYEVARGEKCVGEPLKATDQDGEVRQEVRQEVLQEVGSDIDPKADSADEEVAEALFEGVPTEGADNMKVHVKSVEPDLNGDVDSDGDEFFDSITIDEGYDPTGVSTPSDDSGGRDPKSSTGSSDPRDVPKRDQADNADQIGYEQQVWLDHHSNGTSCVCGIIAMWITFQRFHPRSRARVRLRTMYRGDEHPSA